MAIDMTKFDDTDTASEGENWAHFWSSLYDYMETLQIGTDNNHEDHSFLSTILEEHQEIPRATSALAIIVYDQNAARHTHIEYFIYTPSGRIAYKDPEADSEFHITRDPMPAKDFIAKFKALMVKHLQELGDDGMPKWPVAAYNQFTSDMLAAGYKVVSYHGRFYYHGPAVHTGYDNQPTVQDVIRATKITIQQDSLGLGQIVYPSH